MKMNKLESCLLSHLLISSILAAATPAASGGRTDELLNLFTNDNSRSNDNSPWDPLLAKRWTPIANKLGPNNFFCDQSPNALSGVKDIKHILAEFSGKDEFVGGVRQLQLHSNLNPHLLIRGVLAALLEREDKAEFKIPLMLDVQPEFVLQVQFMEEIKKQADKEWTRSGEEQQKCVLVDGRHGAGNGLENSLWYFREDVMVNSNHMYYHLLYPTNAERRRDRRGELFYFIHHNILARYEAERLSNSLPPLHPIQLNRNCVIDEPFDPHFVDSNSGLRWTPRSSFHKLVNSIDVRKRIPFNVSYCETIYERLIEAIQSGRLLVPNHPPYPLNNPHGIDALSDALDSTRFSYNLEYYGSPGYHASGHRFIGYTKEPLLGARGVMCDTGTSMRDPAFYRWHKHLDDVFNLHKEQLSPYQYNQGEFELSWAELKVSALLVKEVKLKAAHTKHRHRRSVNELTTFWTTHKLNMTAAPYFKRELAKGTGEEEERKVAICLKHLDHHPFQYHITLEAEKSLVGVKGGEVRLFLAPRFKLDGSRLTMNEQRRHFFLLDTFTVKFEKGKKKFVRDSVDSALTVPWPDDLLATGEGSRVYCGCGWPHHLLLPKGKREGMVYDLLAVVSPTTSNVVPETSLPPVGKKGERQCDEAHILCGSPSIEGPYPSSLPFGYPLDRTICQLGKEGSCEEGSDEVKAMLLEEFVQHAPNMATTQLTIFHDDEVDTTD